MTKTTQDDLKSRRWRLNNLYMIVDRHGQKVIFKMNEDQEALYTNQHYQNIILKARQRGFTTFIQILMLDACLFNSNTYAGVIAHNREDAEDFFSKKIKFAYDNLPPSLKAAIPSTQDSAKMLSFANGSSIRVGTSLRSGTYHYLHISEFGKICARYPEKAKEIVTGALNTVHAGQFVFIESTAEGSEGYFYEFCQEAQNVERMGSALTALDMKFHFFPWWRDGEYRVDPRNVAIPEDLKQYFALLEIEHGVTLDDAQKAWYAKKLKTQGDDMKREYPSTPGEAFEAAIEGAFYSRQMAAARKEGRIGRVPYDPALVVNTWWDIGMNDATAIWLHQNVGKENRLIGYYENSGEGIDHYAGWLKTWAAERTAQFGTHIMPHDVNVREWGGRGKSRKETAMNLGIKPIQVIARTPNLLDDIQGARNFLASCWIDEESCSQGIRCLDNYRKAWDAGNEVFRNQPLHNWASNGADAFRQGANGFKPPQKFKPMPKTTNSKYKKFRR